MRMSVRVYVDACGTNFVCVFCEMATVRRQRPNVECIAVRQGELFSLAVRGIQKCILPGAPHGKTAFFSEPFRPPITSFYSLNKKQPLFLFNIGNACV